MKIGIWEPDYKPKENLILTVIKTRGFFGVFFFFFFFFFFSGFFFFFLFGGGG